MITFDYKPEDKEIVIDFGGVGSNYHKGTQQAIKFAISVLLPDGTRIRCMKWYYIDNKNFDGGILNELTGKECIIDFEKILPRQLLDIIRTCTDALTYKK